MIVAFFFYICFVLNYPIWSIKYSLSWFSFLFLYHPFMLHCLEPVGGFIFMLSITVMGHELEFLRFFFLLGALEKKQ